MVVAAAQTPREKTFQPFFSWTTQCSPAAFTLRVRAASPGGRSTQPSGAIRILPSTDWTEFGVGPGVKVVSLILVLPCFGDFLSRIVPRYWLVTAGLIPFDPLAKRFQVDSMIGEQFDKLLQSLGTDFLPTRS